MLTTLKRELNFTQYRLRYKLLHKKPLSAFHHLSSPHHTDPVIVTFTTTPERIHHIDIMIKSLLDQTIIPTKIICAIPTHFKKTGEPYTIPDWFKDIPLLEVLTADQDYGPGTKLIPTWKSMRNHPNAKLIITDDDQVYAKTFIETLLTYANKLPECALGFSGMIVPSGMAPSDILGSNDIDIKSCRVSTSNIHQLTPVNYLFGFAGEIVKPKFFDERLLDYTGAPDGAFFEDDLWIGGHLARNHVDRIVIPSPLVRQMPAPSKKTIDTYTLCEHDNQDGSNMDAVYHYYQGLINATD